MQQYSDLLNKAVNAIGDRQEQSSLEAFLEGDGDLLFKDEAKTLSDFELISFFVVKAEA